ncbi:hypothetical protein ACFVMC_07215 [Nocardia sp. NPDC127579]|uniref:hypothetical protein n=1 Tax=Nocardia sp. NPDC127579 TaxID=3345402 RepID=UPI00363F5CB4
MGDWSRRVVGVYSAVLTLVICGPLLGSGYLLLRDAVSTPRSYSTDSALGLGDAAPRAVPQDGLLAVLSPVVDGGVLVKAILVVALWMAGYGAAVLARELLRVGVGPQLVATTVALWNPYVAERLLQGHWSLLAGYAALPWTALAAHRLRTVHNCPQPGERCGWRARAPLWGALAASFAAAGLTPTGALLAGTTALVLVGRRRVLGTLVLLAAASAPWLTATALSGAGAEPSDPAGIAAFAARAEPGLGTLGSLAGLGGIWNADAVPASRTTLLALIGTAILLALVATGLRTVIARNTSRADGESRVGSIALDGSHLDSPAAATVSADLRTGRTLLLLAAVAVALPALAATGWGRDTLEWMVIHIPGAGLLRDTQKYVALAVPGYALCAAAGCRVLARRFGKPPTAAAEPDSGSADTDTTTTVPRCGPTESSTSASGLAADNSPTAISPGATSDAPVGAAESPATAVNSPVERSRAELSTAVHKPGAALVAAAFIALLILPMVDLAWGVGGGMRPVRYPGGWAQVVEWIDGPGDVAVLPGGMFRKFPYSGTAPVLDPAPRMLPADVLQTGALPVRGAVVAGEGKRARQVESLLLQGSSVHRLADLGVGWVLVERTTPGPLGASKTTLAELDPVYGDDQLTLYRVPNPRLTETDAAHRFLAIAAHILWAAVLLGGLLVGARKAG